jgi:DHA2 family multidrug resistance protein
MKRFFGGASSAALCRWFGMTGMDEKQPFPNRGLITISVMLATIMQALDSTIANVALPHMQGSLSGTQDQMSWVLTSYIVAAAITIPLTGWLSRRFDRKMVFLVSIALFTIASALCGLAQSLPQLVLFRLMQGVGGAALVPLSQAILFDINPPENHGKAMGAWGMGVTMGPILGPALGGWLTEDYDWRWVFYINLPIGVLAFMGLLLFLPKSGSQHADKFDVFGFITLSLGVGALQMMMDRGELKDWFSSNEIITEAVIAGLSFYLFFVHMATYDKPFIRPALFRDRNFVTSNVFIFIVGIVLFATLALVPPMLQGLMNYPVILTGLVTAPRGCGTMVAMFMVGRLLSIFDARKIMAVGLALTAFSLWQMTHFSLLMDQRLLIVSGVLQGFGIGLVWVPLSTVAFATLNPSMRAEGTAFFNLLRNIGASIGISIVEFLLTSNTQVLHESLGQNITAVTAIGNPAAFQDMHIDTSTAGGLEALNGMVTQQASMIAYLDDFKLMMIITIGVIPLLLLLKRNRVAKTEHAAVMD